MPLTGVINYVTVFLHLYLLCIMPILVTGKG